MRKETKLTELQLEKFKRLAAQSELMEERYRAAKGTLVAEEKAVLADAAAGVFTEEEYPELRLEIATGILYKELEAQGNAALREVKSRVKAS